MKWQTCSILAVLFGGCHVDVIPDRDLTYSAIGETFFRIHLYAKANGTLPPSLNLLPERSGYTNQITDAWHRPLAYDIDADGILTIRSLGQDGAVGGSGDDGDIVVKYRGRDGTGKVIAGQELWVVDGEIKQ
ncbi:type II secretion system protein GspG [Hydrogenophaga sp. A37]|uniref:type II secretion system protein GspG n=1 Tax=Hydrogenophaga sp. A37 TaxID=1945864 RepID=UPI0015C5647E|nr:type II secretion system protein GspG [Hydrogenophaga sp. A37]